MGAGGGGRGRADRAAALQVQACVAGGQRRDHLRNGHGRRAVSDQRAEALQAEGALAPWAARAWAPVAAHWRSGLRALPEFSRSPTFAFSSGARPSPCATT